MKKFVIFMIMFFMVASNAYAKSFSSSRSSFSSSKTSYSSYRSTSNNNSKKTNYSSSSTVDASKWSWNKPSPPPSKPAYQPTNTTKPTARSVVMSKPAVVAPVASVAIPKTVKPVYVQRQIVLDKPKYTYAQKPAVVYRERNSHRDNDHIPLIAVAAVAIASTSDNVYANTQNVPVQIPNPVLVDTQQQLKVSSVKPIKIKFDFVNDCEKWVCN
jgi:hypothetical protein